MWTMWYHERWDLWEPSGEEGPILETDEEGDDDDD